MLVTCLALLGSNYPTEYSLFKSVNCSSCFGWHFTHHQDLQYLALMRSILLPVVIVAGRDTFTTGSSNGLINARYCRYSVMSSWWWVNYHPKYVEQLTDLNKLYSVASCWIIITKYNTMHGPLNIKYLALVIDNARNKQCKICLCLTVWSYVAFWYWKNNIHESPYDNNLYCFAFSYISDLPCRIKRVHKYSTNRGTTSKF